MRTPKRFREDRSLLYDLREARGATEISFVREVTQPRRYDLECPVCWVRRGRDVLDCVGDAVSEGYGNLRLDLDWDWEEGGGKRREAIRVTCLR
jgi:hypothetical protein